MANMNVGILTYNEARTFFINAADRRPRPYGVKIGHNTYLHQRGDDYAIRYHDTDIVTIHPDNTYTLNSGGFKTVTTKQRIGTLAPGYLYQSRKVWYLNGGRVPFFDGIRVDCNGKVV